MIQGLRFASIWSENLNNLLPFYRDTLGLPVGMESPEFVIFGDPNAPSLGLGTHSEVHGANTDPARHMVGLGTDDIDGDYERLKGKGVEFIETPTAGSDGGQRMATLKDPEGNLIQLFQFTEPM